MTRRFLAAILAPLVGVVAIALPSAPAEAVTGCKLSVVKPDSLVVGPVTASGPAALSMTLTSVNCGTPKRWIVGVVLPGTDLHAESANGQMQIPVSPSALKRGSAKPGAAYQVRVTAVFPDGSMANNWTTKVAFKQDTRLTGTPKALGSGKVQVTGKLQRYDWKKAQWVALGSAKVYSPLEGWSAKTTSKGVYTIKFAGQTPGATITPTFVYSTTSAYDKASVMVSVTVK